MEFKVGLGLETGTYVNLKTLGYKINKSNEKGGWETDISTSVQNVYDGEG